MFSEAAKKTPHIKICTEKSKQIGDQSADQAATALSAPVQQILPSYPRRAAHSFSIILAFVASVRFCQLYLFELSRGAGMTSSFFSSISRLNEDFSSMCQPIYDHSILLCVTVFLGCITAALVGLYVLLFWRIQMPTRKVHYPEPANHTHHRATAFPPPYPNSWWKLCDSKDLKPGAVRSICALGQKFAVFRTMSGKVSVLDAFCPHLAADLTQGKVCGESLQCPFHAWKWGIDGKCTNIPYADKIPANAIAKSWPVRERWGLVIVWYHCDGLPPSWEVNEMPELLKDDPYTLRYEYNDTVDMHVQDFAENGPDWAHFGPVHGQMTIPLTDYFLCVRHRTNWTNGAFGTKDHHMGYFSDDADLQWKWDEGTDKILENAGAKVTATFHGPGLVIFRFITAAGNISLVKTFTPFEPLKNRMEDRVYASPGCWNILAKYIVMEANTQFYEDIKIWAAKSYTTKPMVIKEDGNILGMRRWFKQFYTKNSRRGLDLTW